MRTNEPVTNIQKDYDAAQKIVSTTDTKGVITSINHDFINISGFTEEELIGQAHNLVRHPSMPQMAFKELWDSNKAEKPWMGMVKNRCKNGDHYWVDAFVTPIVENGQVLGYQSVRQKPTEEMIEQAEKIYQRSSNPVNKLIDKVRALPLSYKLFCCFSLIGAAAISAPSTLAAIGIMVLGNIFLSFLIARPWEQLKSKLKIYLIAQLPKMSIPADTMN